MQAIQSRFGVVLGPGGERGCNSVKTGAGGVLSFSAFIDQSERQRRSVSLAVAREGILQRLSSLVADEESPRFRADLADRC